jgi:hypothetical protein
VRESELPAGLREEWDRVLAGWDDAGAHAVFVERCAQADSLDLAAGCYRPLLADPAKAERARVSLDRIVALAEQALQRTATPPSTAARNRAILTVLAALLTLGFLVAVAVAVLSR